MAPIHAERRDRHEGPRAGAFAATAVWLWILIRDMHARMPFSTPAFLGRGLLSVDGGGAGVPAIAGVTGILAQSRLGPGAWYEMLIGDVIGWTALGWHVYRRHHELRGELARAGRDEP